MLQKPMQNNASPYSYRVEANPVGLFETPIAYCRLQQAENLLHDLLAAIQKNKREDAGLVRSNAGGWHSNTQMLQWGGAAARKLAETAVSVAKRMSHFEESSVDQLDWQVRMWANVTAPGGLNQLHMHPGNLWAAVLYLDKGGDKSGDKDGATDQTECGGELYLEDPRFPLTAMHNTAFRLLGSDGTPQRHQLELNVERGNLVVFPAWLRHGVRVYRGQRERISIAMNIDASPRR